MVGRPCGTCLFRVVIRVQLRTSPVQCVRYVCRIRAIAAWKLRKRIVLHSRSLCGWISQHRNEGRAPQALLRSGEAGQLNHGGHKINQLSEGTGVSPAFEPGDVYNQWHLTVKFKYAFLAGR